MSETDAVLVLTDHLEEQYLSYLAGLGRSKQTVSLCRRSMNELYDFLPEDKEITPDGLDEWKD